MVSRDHTVLLNPVVFLAPNPGPSGGSPGPGSEYEECLEHCDEDKICCRDGSCKFDCPDDVSPHFQSGSGIPGTDHMIKLADESCIDIAGGWGGGESWMKRSSSNTTTDRGKNGK